MGYLGFKLKKIIKPCPFCGEYPVLNKGTYGRHLFSYWIKCENRNCAMGEVSTRGSEDMKEVLRKWNTRSYETD